MKKLLFVCLGNICRSPMAEFIMKDLAEKAGLAGQLQIDSAATIPDETGNPVYPPARKKLLEYGIDPAGKTARQLTREDYGAYDLLIGMENANLRDMERICGGDPEGKFRLLLSFAGRQADIADPWFTGEFQRTYEDVLEGCQGLLSVLKTQL
jgi:protein-tyrosine phosphatase